MNQRWSTRVEHELDSRSVGVTAWLYRRTRGRIAQLYRRDVLLLTTTGRRSGRERTVPLQFFPDGSDMVVVAANSGLSTDPAWYLNLTAEPDAVVEVGADRLEVRADVMGADEAARFWDRVLERAPDYARYLTRTERTIPLVRLRPTGPRDGTGSPATQRPVEVRAASGALWFVGLTAIAGGLEMIAAPHGNVFVDGRWLDQLPLVETYRLPGTALSALGLAASVTAHGLSRLPERPRSAALEEWTGHHWSWTATIGVGAALSAWIALEVAVVPDRSPLEALYGLTGVGLVAAAASPALRRHTARSDARRRPARGRGDGGGPGARSGPGGRSTTR